MKGKSWYVVAKLSGNRFESIADARAHGNREFGDYSAACELRREFKRAGIEAKCKKAKATGPDC